MTRFLDVVLSQPWALESGRARDYLQILNGSGDLTPEALEGYRAQAAQRGERLSVRDGVGILRVEGPLFKRANILTEFCGATSYEVLRRDLQAALDNPDIKSILLTVDSPGGEANGCDELATAIYQARGAKPITAYVSGMAASGGYWIASAAERVVVSELAILGSIGVVLGVEDRSAADARRGVRNVQFVSSQSPGKRPDPTTDKGRSQIQAIVDDLAAVFVGAVAKHRRVTTDAVIKNFGAGGVKIGAKAVASGMADEVGQFETVLASLNKRVAIARPNKPGTVKMSDTYAAAADAAKDRIRAITASEDGNALPHLAQHLAFETDVSPAVATGILKAARSDLKSGGASAHQTGNPGAQPAGDWKKATAAANRSIGVTEASEAPAVENGWGKATAAANASIGVKN